MPTVRAPGGPRVQTQSIPNVSVDARSSIESFGGGRSLDAMTGAITDFVGSQIDKANKLVALEADNELTEFKMNFMNKASQRRGRDAFGIQDEFDSEYSKKVSEIQGRLNVAQREVFDPRSNQAKLEMTDAINRHVAAESLAYDKSQTDIGLKLAADEAANDPTNRSIVDASIAKQKQLINGAAERNGLGEDWVKQKTYEQVSNTHANVIGQMANSKNIGLANQYFKEKKSEIEPEQRAKIEKMLTEQNKSNQATVMADTIVDQYDNRNKALEVADDIKDGEMREKVKSYINSSFNIREQNEKQSIDARYLSVEPMVMAADKNIPLDQIIPATDYAQMTKAQLDGLERQRKTGVKTKARLWNEFYFMADSDIAQMSAPDFQIKYWSNFGDDERKQAKERFDRIHNPKGGEFTNNSANYFNEMLGNSLGKAGIINNTLKIKDLPSAQAEILKNISFEAKKRLDDFELKNGQSTPQEKQKIIDETIMDRGFVDNTWTRDKISFARDISDPDEKKKFKIPYASIPPAQKLALENLLRSNNVVVSQERIELIMGAYRLGDQQRADALAKGMDD